MKRAALKTRHPEPVEGPLTIPAPVGPPVNPVNPVQKLSRPAFARIIRKLEATRRRAQPPRIDSFTDFLQHHAQVKTGSGYANFRFEGREAMRPIVAQLDAILASGETDASLALCGGAQFGKTVLLLNLLAYLVAVRFRNVGYYLPDDDLVAGLVDGKLRPDVLDRIPWLARLLAVGKTLSASGRAVNRKGAFLCTDGQRTALAFMRGLGKIPTSFSMDVVIQDEKDDLPEEHARFLSGRMTASNLRLSLIIGTQRYHGAGQNLAFTEGTQHIALVPCPGCGARHNPETQWPGICRLRLPGVPAADQPRLTPEGHFAFSPSRQRPSKIRHPELVEPSVQPPPSTLLPIPYAPGQTYLLACPDCGAELDRHHPEWHAQAPERMAQRRWSYRLSQLLFPAIDLAQIVAAWQLAIRDAAQMNVFCTDRLALPKSSTQTLTPHDLQAARADYTLPSAAAPAAVAFMGGESNQLSRQRPFQIRHPELVEGPLTILPSGSSPSPEPGSVSQSASISTLPPFDPTQTATYGGLDLGDQCWFVARAVELAAPHRARLLWIEPIAAERVRDRVPELFRALQLTALCVDAGPLRDLSRDLAFALNDLGDDAHVSGDDPTHNLHFIRAGSTLPLRWHAASERWQEVRCAPVEFTQREDSGLRHKIGRTQEGRLYPLLAAHRDESIRRVIGELLPPADFSPRLAERADGTAVALTSPRFELPTPSPATRAALDLYERHLLAGARQERTADGRTLRYLDQCENHYLLATAYAALAELLHPPRPVTTTVASPIAFRPLPALRTPRSRAVIG